MYSLVFLPGACSLAVQVVLRELGQEVELTNKATLTNFNEINPVGTVPVLMDQDTVMTEGAAILIHLLNKHPSSMFPSSAPLQQQCIENIMFANATMHPAYGRLFFGQANISHDEQRQDFLEQAASAINHLWQVVDNKLADQPFLGGQTYSAADILLAVYSRWGSAFPVDIRIPARASEMIERVIALPSFQAALSAEAALS